jgi:hypothetical protein
MRIIVPKKYLKFFTFSFDLYVSLKLTPDAKLWIKKYILPYKACSWGVCYKPAVRTVKAGIRPDFHPELSWCHRHAMWTCRSRNYGFDLGVESGKNFRKAIKRHKQHEWCLPDR